MGGSGDLWVWRTCQSLKLCRRILNGLLWGVLVFFFFPLSLRFFSFFSEKCFKSRFVIYIKELLSSSDALDRHKMPGLSGNENLSYRERGRREGRREEEQSEGEHFL